MEVGNEQRALLGSEQLLTVGEEAGPFGRKSAKLLLWPERPTLGMTETALIIGHHTGLCVPHKRTVEAVGIGSERLPCGTEVHA